MWVQDDQLIAYLDRVIWKSVSRSFTAEFVNWPCAIGRNHGAATRQSWLVISG
jgi:hypothetical protein